MSIRFRKSIKLFPGFRINIGKSGVSSFNVGPRGASVSFTKKGTYLNSSLGMGTGISMREKIGGSNYQNNGQITEQEITGKQTNSGILFFIAVVVCSVLINIIFF